MAPDAWVNEEPVDLLAKVEHYRHLLDETPEWWPLTRSGQQVYSVTEVEQLTHGMISAHQVREAVRAGLIEGAVPGVGPKATQVPRSRLILYLGRLVSGWYARRGGSEKANAAG